MRAFVPYLPPAKTVAGSSASSSFDYIGANALGAWDIAALKTGVTRCFRVRRSSDNAEQDCLTVAEAVTFCGGGNGFLAKLYDQNGSNDLSQSTTTLQPRIVSSGVADAGLVLDGTNDVMQAASTLIDTNMTFGGWYKFTSNAGAYWLIGKGLNVQWQLFMDSSTLRLRMGASKTVNYGISGLSAAWHHIMATVNGTTGTIYIDGVSVASGTVNAMPSVNADPVLVGSYDLGGTSSPFSGSMRDIRVYGVTKSAAEVLAIKQSVTP